MPQNIPESRRLFFGMASLVCYTLAADGAYPTGCCPHGTCCFLFTRIITSAWWRAQAKDLFAITEEGEMGIRGTLKGECVPAVNQIPGSSFEYVAPFHQA